MRLYLITIICLGERRVQVQPGAAIEHVLDGYPQARYVSVRPIAPISLGGAA